MRKKEDDGFKSESEEAEQDALEKFVIEEAIGPGKFSIGDSRQ
jgi:hypothetical protein